MKLDNRIVEQVPLLNSARWKKHQHSVHLQDQLVHLQPQRGFLDCPLEKKVTDALTFVLDNLPDFNLPTNSSRLSFILFDLLPLGMISKFKNNELNCTPQNLCSALRYFFSFQFLCTFVSHLLVKIPGGD